MSFRYPARRSGTTGKRSEGSGLRFGVPVYRYQRLMWSQSDTQGDPALDVPTTAASESTPPELRERVVADIARVRQLLEESLGPVRGMTFNQYVAAGGRFPKLTIRLLGGWRSVITDVIVTREDKCAEPAPVVLAEIIADIARIAAMVPSTVESHGLSFPRYAEAGGEYKWATIEQMGGWRALCRAANVHHGTPGGRRRTVRHEWQKTGSASSPMFDEALDTFLGRLKNPKALLSMYGLRRCRRPVGRWKKRAVSAAPLLERSDVIVDIRDVSRRAGLTSPRLLTWESYTAHGGLYAYDQIKLLGGFALLRRDAE
jgi:hypothetical protein